MNKIIKKEDWYENLVEDCKAIITETGFNSNLARIEGYHQLGERITDDEGYQKYGKGNKKFLDKFAADLGKSRQTIYFALEFYDKYKVLSNALETLPEGKKISWHKICNKYLKQPREYPEKDRWLRVFDVWNFASIDNRFGKDYPGRIPYEIIANTLHYFTKEEDLVVDPMAGGGTTVDVCKMMKRKCLAYDLVPSREDIKNNKLEEGLPKETQNCDLIFLDPPYWKKKVDDYNKDSISSWSKKRYLAFFEDLAIEGYKKLKNKGIFAFLMSNYIDYENPKESIFVADYYNLFLKAGFIPLYEIQCPLSTQQYQAFQVSKAKEGKKILIISRSLFVYGKI